MFDKIMSVFSVSMGAILILAMIYSVIRSKIDGIKYLDGKIIGINPDNHALIIRYKVSQNEYQDLEYSDQTGFYSENSPIIGLKVRVMVKAENPHKPLHVHMTTKWVRGEFRGYMNDSRMLTIVRISGLGLFMIIVGILLFIGVF